MYSEHFGFTDKPFKLSPDQRFIYASPAHDALFDQVLTAVQARRPLIVLTGPAGSGKTVLLRRLLRDMSPFIQVLRITGTRLPLSEQLVELGHGVDLDLAALPVAERLRELQRTLRERRDQGQTLLLVADDAHALDDAVLLDLLSLGRTDGDGPLFSTLFAGLPSLDDRLRGEDDALRYALPLLDEDGVGGFIRHQLAQAGYPRDDLFTPNSVASVYALTAGNPRTVSSLCDSALFLAALEGQRVITPELIDQAAVQCFLKPRDSVAAPPLDVAPISAPPTAPQRITELSDNDARAALGLRFGSVTEELAAVGFAAPPAADAATARDTTAAGDTPPASEQETALEFELPDSVVRHRGKRAAGDTPPDQEPTRAALGAGGAPADAPVGRAARGGELPPDTASTRPFGADAPPPLVAADHAEGDAYAAGTDAARDERLPPPLRDLRPPRRRRRWPGRLLALLVLALIGGGAVLALRPQWLGLDTAQLRAYLTRLTAPGAATPAGRVSNDVAAGDAAAVGSVAELLNNGAADARPDAVAATPAVDNAASGAGRADAVDAAAGAPRDSAGADRSGGADDVGTTAASGAVAVDSGSRPVAADAAGDSAAAATVATSPSATASTADAAGDAATTGVAGAAATDAAADDVTTGAAATTAAASTAATTAADSVADGVANGSGNNPTDSLADNLADAADATANAPPRDTAAATAVDRSAARDAVASAGDASVTTPDDDDARYVDELAAPDDGGTPNVSADAATDTADAADTADTADAADTTDTADTADATDATDAADAADATDAADAADAARRINALLARAERQLAERLLTTPADNNAFRTYNEVLALDPDNAAAVDGLATIGRTYRRWGEQAAASGRLTNAISYYQRALTVDPTDAAAQAALQTLRDRAGR